MNERELYEASLDLLSHVLPMPRKECEAFLSDHCREQPELAEYILSLHDAATARSSLDMMPPADADFTIGDEPGGPEPTQIGRYRIIRRLGEGGMGVVYEAEQENPSRRIALKVMRFGVLASANRRRFEFEKDILARLQHPGIAQILEAGVFGGDDGRPYFALELIEGRPITAYADENDLSLCQRIDLIINLCDAVHYAHQRGVIHRDLKPSNILIDANGRPKILDFGIARVVDSDVHAATAHTEIGQLIGTLPYMSPEQCGGDPNNIDSRSDVFSLGVVTFELLTGRLPHEIEGKQIPDMLRVIQQERPRTLSDGDRMFPRDLETIVAKALEKEPDRRYSSAAELGAEFNRFLRDEPITARPPTVLYQFAKFSKRNKGLVAGFALAFIVLVAGVIVSSTLAYREAKQREDLRQTVEHLEEVAEYQLTMLVEADPSVLGTAFVQAFREQLSAVRRTDDAGSSLSERRLAQFDELFAMIDATDAARRVHIERLDAAAQSLSERFSDLPVTEARLRQMIAWTYHNYGLYEKALEHTSEALQLRNEYLGSEHKETLYSMTAMGVVYRSLDKVVEAERYYRESLQKQRRALGETHQDTLTTMSNLGALLGELGRLDESIPLLRRAAEELEATSGAEHPHTLSAYHNLSAILAKNGEYEEAAEVQRAVAAGRAVFGEEHISMVHLRMGLASRQRDAGHLDEAESAARDAVELADRLLGAGHELTLRAKHTLMLILNDQGAFDESEALGREALASLQDASTAPGDLVTSLPETLAHALRSKRQYAEAAALLKQVFEHHHEEQKHRSAQETARRLEQLFQEWEDHVPGMGHAHSARDWKQRAGQRIPDDNDQ